MGISRFGSRFQEKIDAAEQRRLDEAERLRALTPADKVSEAAANLELLFQTGEALARALEKGLVEVERQKTPIRVDSDGWYEAGRDRPIRWTTNVGFQVRYDLLLNGYKITAGGTSVRGHRDYFVPDEVLNDASSTIVTFNEWIMRVSRALFVVLVDPWFTGSENSPKRIVTTEALEQLESAGVQFVNGRKDSREEEAAAIASIRRALEEQ